MTRFQKLSHTKTVTRASHIHTKKTLRLVANFICFHPNRGKQRTKTKKKMSHKFVTPKRSQFIFSVALVTTPVPLNSLYVYVQICSVQVRTHLFDLSKYPRVRERERERERGERERERREGEIFMHA